MSSKTTDTHLHQPIILFDGVCNLCSRFVIFVLSREKTHYFRFASLQSELGQSLRGDTGTGFLNSIVLIENSRRYKKSTAVLRIFRHLKYLWPMLYCFVLVPAPLRNLVYDYIGNRRYQWFGERQHCWIPTADIASRFVDSRADIPESELVSIVASLNSVGKRPNE